MSFKRQLFQIINENASNSRKNRKFTCNVKGFVDHNRQDNNNDFRQKNKIYVVDENDENEIIEKSFAKNFHDDQNVFYSQDFNYYDLNNNFDDDENDIIVVYFVVFTFAIECRRCYKTFDFNNQLHIHLRIECQISRKIFAIFIVEISFIVVIKIINMSIEIEFASIDVLSKISNFEFF